MLFPPFGLFTCRECNRTIFFSKWNFSATDVYLCPNYSQSVFVPFRLDVISWIIYFTSVSIFTWGECNSNILVLNSSWLYLQFQVLIGRAIYLISFKFQISFYSTNIM